MNLWNNQAPISDLDTNLTVPAWIEQDITPYDVAAICQGGCASGAYMPAVTYSDAVDVMAKHGDDVLQYIEEIYGELPQPPRGRERAYDSVESSWSQMAVFYLSIAVELWASMAHDTLEDISDRIVQHSPSPAPTGQGQNLWGWGYPVQGRPLTGRYIQS